MDKTLNVWVKDMNRKQVVTDGNVVRQKALNLYGDFSKVSPEMSDTQPFPESKRW